MFELSSRTIALALFASGLQLTTASAAPRAFVSGKGVDSPSCGPVATPCRTPQYAHDTIVDPGGEIDILDPAGYGAITITKAISIINDGAGIAGFLATAGGNAITINAGTSDTIVLRGLTIEGSGIGSNGVAVQSMQTLIMSNCSAQGFVTVQSQTYSGAGVTVNPSVNKAMFIRISNSDLSNNQGSGFSFRPNSAESANIVIDHVTATNDGVGFAFLSTQAPTSFVAISNSTASNGTTGFNVNGFVTATISNSTASGNATGLLAAGSAATVYLSRSTIENNSSNGVRTLLGVINSYGDNHIDGNGTDVNGTLTTLARQ